MADVNNSRRPNPFLVALAVVGALSLAAVSFVVLLVGWAFKSVPEFTGKLNSSEQYLGRMGFDKAIAGIRLEGEVTAPLAGEIVEKLQEAGKDSRVAGVLLEVNSPGGSVVASQEIYDTIKTIKANKPVVAYVREMAASGAYYSSASASKIVANRGSLVGSIGVILSSMEATQLIEWLKLRPVTLKTGKLKDSGSPLREWTPEDKEYLQTLINKTREQFVADVKEQRPVDESALAEMSDGRVVLGTRALELKLIDSLGTKETALKEVSTLAGLPETPELIYMEEQKEFPQILSDILREEKLNIKNELKKELSGTLSGSIQLK